MTIEEFRNLANEAFNFYDSSLTGEEIEEALLTARGIGYGRTMIKGTGLGGFEPAVPGEDYDYVLLKGSGAPDMYTEAAIGQHYLNTTATENPYEYVCVAYSRENGYQWRPLSGVSEIDPKAQGSFRLNPVANENKGWFSTAMGISCVAEGDYSHATGYSARAAGKQAHAEGYYTSAVGDSSHAEGERALAQGEAAHAEGTDTAAYGTNAHAEGLGTQAGSENQHVQGKYNVRDNNNKYAHIVGNGTENERSNAHTLDWNGNAWFKGKVFIGGTGADDPEAVELGTGGGSSGGSGADLLNDNGVIKQEHLPEGYPYSEVDEAYALPETTIVPLGDDGSAPLTSTLSLIEGQTYTVNWNGTDYECICSKVENDGDGDGVIDTQIGLGIGNIGLMIGGATTEEPFIIIELAPEFAAELGVPSMVQILDGSASVVLSITGVTETKTIIARKYLPDGYPYEERIEGVLLPETEAGSLTAVPLQLSSLIVGETYIVTVGGVEYETTCKLLAASGYAGKYLGNLASFGFPDTGEPFVIIPTEDGEGASVAFENGERQIISVTGPSIVIHPMAEKYMPGAQEKEVLTYLVDIDGIGNLHPTYDELVAAIRVGKAISYRYMGSSYAWEFPFLKWVSGVENPYIVFQHVMLEENTATATVKQYILYRDGPGQHREFQWPPA